MNNDDDLILVEAARPIVPFHDDDAPAGRAGGGLFQLRPEDGPTEVPNTVGNRRKIRGGDLTVVEINKTLPGPATSAALASEDLLGTSK